MKIRHIHLTLDQVLKQGKGDIYGSIQLNVLYVVETQQITVPTFISIPFNHWLILS